MQETPIPLRLHHLDNIQQIMRKGIKKYEETFRQKLTILKTNSTSHDYPIYYDDTVGPPGNETRHIVANLGAYQGYLNLDNAHPIDLIPKDKDLICQTCFEGNHCFNEFFYVSEASLADRLENCITTNNLIGLFERHGTILERNFHVITTMGIIRTTLTTDELILSY